MSEYEVIYHTTPRPCAGEKPYHGKIIITQAADEVEARRVARRVLRKRWKRVGVEVTIDYVSTFKSEINKE